MDELDGLLNAVLDNPADDTPRLIYADAMEESGQAVNHARAEFIRLQIAGEGQDRQHELLEVWLTNWFDQRPRPLSTGWWAIGEFGDPSAFQFEITRGFISGIATHGLPEDDWNPWTPWRIADGFIRNVMGLFVNHPLDRIRHTIGDGEEWRIGAYGDPEEHSVVRWACQAADRSRVLCHHFVRRRFASNLERALRDHILDLAADVWAVRQVMGNQDQALGAAIREQHRRRLTGY